MKVLLNGRLVEESAARVSVFDRGFLYGDGLFETLVVWNGRPFRWQEHLQRLQAGAKALRVRLPVSPGEMETRARRLIAANQVDKGVLRLAISRGVGPRGYSPKDAESPTWVMSLHPLPPVKPGKPEAWTLHTATNRVLGGDPLARFKTANKLTQILARTEAEAAGADEALLLNDRGQVAEAASGNIFWLQGQVLATPPLYAGALPGITRMVLFELAGKLQLQAAEVATTPDVFQAVDAVFVTLSTLGVVEVSALDGKPLRRSPLVGQIHAAYWRQVATECGRGSARR